jgi:hypothetical protein
VRAEPAVKAAGVEPGTGKERVLSREDSVARTEGRAFSKVASSRIRVRMVGTSGGAAC